MDRALIVSAGQSSNEYLAKHLSAMGFPRPTIAASGGEARRLLDSNAFQVTVVNAPLPDEFGHELSIYTAQKSLSGVVLIAKTGVIDDAIDRLAEHGVLVLPKPFNAAQFSQAIRFARSSNKRLELLKVEYNKLQEKLQQLRLVDRAKCCLIEKKGMTEGDAHRYIEKAAMDTRCTRGEVAQHILDENG